MNKDLNTYGKYVRDAAQLRLVIEQRLKDHELLRQQQELYYAVDTDIVKLFTQPAESATLQETGGGGYTQIFHDDSPEVCTILAQALAEYIFYHLVSEEKTILILPPHDNEIKNVYFGVARNAEREHKKAFKQEERLHQLINKYKQKLISKEELTDKLEQDAGAVFEFLYGSGQSPSEDLRRFSKLLKKQCIATPDHLLKTNQIKEKIVQKAFSPARNVPEMINFNNMKNSWEQLLRRHKRKPRKKNNESVREWKIKEIKWKKKLETDTAALARLEWINNKLPEDKKLLFITGDKAIAKAAATVKCFPGSHITFADRFIKHPQCFLADKRILYKRKSGTRQEKDRNEHSELVEWLETYFPKKGYNEHQYFQELLSLSELKVEFLAAHASKMIQKEPFCLENLNVKWNEYTKKVNIYVTVTPSTREVIQSSARKYLDNIEKLDIPKLLCDQVKETWDDFFTIAIESGASLLDDHPEGKSLPRRVVPALTIHSRSKAQKYADKILQLKESSPSNFSLGQIYEEDQTNYPYYLISSLLFASRGHWSICATLCKRALIIADRTGESNGFVITGHEAAYLLAVSLRHSAKSMKQLHEIEGHLNNASKRLAKEEGQTGDDIRFTGEKLVLGVTKHLFRIFDGDNNPSTDFKGIEECQTELMSFIEQLTKEEQDALMINEKEERMQGLKVVFSVKRQTLINIAMAILLRVKEDEPFDRDELFPFYEQFKNNLFNKPQKLFPRPPVTSLANAIFYATANIFEQEKKEKKKIQEKAKKLLSDSNIEQMAATPFDKNRLKFLRLMAV